MPFRIVRNDITRMDTEAVVNTANSQPAVGTGCDFAVYQAAGYDELLKYRTEKIGVVPEGEAFITPGFHLPAKYIIHAVSPYYTDGNRGEEEKLRACYRNCLRLARENGIRSVAFPLISTGGFGYPKEEGLRIAVDEIGAFLLEYDMDIRLVVFDDRLTALGGRLYPDLEEYIDRNYVELKRRAEYGPGAGRVGDGAPRPAPAMRQEAFTAPAMGQEAYSDQYTETRMLAPMPPAPPEPKKRKKRLFGESVFGRSKKDSLAEQADMMACASFAPEISEEMELDFETQHESRLEERMKHISDTFSEYLLYLIRDKNMENAEVYKRAIVDKKTFSKLKNNADYHPQKLTALCLCVGARLNLDESKDLLARAGYALSPCDKTDIIFSYFIENGIYDMIELDIQLEEHGLPCIIS